MKEDFERLILINTYKTLVDFMAETLGEECEIALHEIKENQVEIVAIRNKHHSNREIGEKIDAIGKKVYEIEKNIRYRANYSKMGYQGKEMKSSSFYIKKQNEEVVGILCFNFDISLAKMAQKYFETLLPKQEKNNIIDKSTDSVNQITIGMIEETIVETDIPIARMTPAERIEIIKNLQLKGVFGIKGAVRQVSKKLEISETSVYRYLKEIE